MCYQGSAADKLVYIIVDISVFLLFFNNAHCYLMKNQKVSKGIRIIQQYKTPGFKATVFFIVHFSKLHCRKMLWVLNVSNVYRRCNRYEKHCPRLPEV